MELKAKTTVEEPQNGAFVRKDAIFRNWISESSEHFKPESGRYHLYISYACPWACRTLMFLKLKGLEEHIGLSIVHPIWQKTRPEKDDDHTGWVFRSEDDEPLKNLIGFGSFPGVGCIPDTVNKCKSVRELYELSDNTGEKYSVPVLWDKKNKVIVNNESSEIIRMFNFAFNKFSKDPSLDLYPEALQGKIDEINEWVYTDINNGVYRSGFAETQEAYESAVNKLFIGLDRVEDILSKSRYLVGNQFTEADVRLFVTLVRFDEAYNVVFKCNKKKIIDYPNLLNFTREVYQMPGIAETVDMYHIKAGYFGMPILNHYGIIPAGPDSISALKERHDRDRFQ